MLVVTSPNNLQRASIAAIAVKAHKDDPAFRLIRDILTSVSTVKKGTPNTEEAIEALFLNERGPFSEVTARDILNALKDRKKFPLSRDATFTKEENAQILGYLAVALARFHPNTPGLKEIIENRIQEMEKDGTLLKSKDKEGEPNPQFSRFIAALHYVSSNSALAIMRKYNIEPDTILFLENEAYS